MFTVHKPAEKIYLLVFDTQENLAKTFLRFQEHYECPKFKDKVFTLDEFKEWYVEQKGSFSYYSDWNGFNIPSRVLDLFRQGKFDLLTKEENKFLEAFDTAKDPYYIIGIHKEGEHGTLTHEIAHALFTVDPTYKTQVLSTIAEYDIKDIEAELREKSGYHEDVIKDEVHAYAIDSGAKLATRIPFGLRERLRAHFARACQRNAVDFDVANKAIQKK